MKKRSLLFGMILALIMSLFGCKSTENNDVENDEYIWGTDMVDVDMYLNIGEQRGFNLPFAYKGGKDNIELVEVKGENTEYLEIKVIDDTMEIFKDIEIEQYKVGFLGIILSIKEEKNVQIQELKIRINENEKSIVLDKPVKIKGCQNCDFIAEYVSADVIMCGIENSVLYKIASDKKITITDFELMGPFQFKEVYAILNNTKISDNKIELNVGQELLFEGISQVEAKNEYGCLGGNFVVYYETEQGKNEKYVFSITQQGAGDGEAGEKVLRQILDK